MTVKEPPVAHSGKKYGTVQERCGACVMRGGSEDPCLNPRALAEYERLQGYPCPHRELDPDNENALEIARYLMSEDLRPMAPRMVELMGLEREEEALALERATYAMHHPSVLKLRFPPPESK